jgi:hypothetical protein
MPSNEAFFAIITVIKKKASKCNFLLKKPKNKKAVNIV